MKKIVLLCLILCMALGGLSFASELEDGVRGPVIKSLFDENYRASFVNPSMMVHMNAARFPGMVHNNRQVFCIEPNAPIRGGETYFYSRDLRINKPIQSWTLRESKLEELNDIIYYGYHKNPNQGPLDIQAVQFMLWEHLGWRVAREGEEEEYGVNAFLFEMLGDYPEKKEAIKAMMDAEPGIAEVTKLVPGGSVELQFSENFPLDKLVVGAVPDGISYETEGQKLLLQADNSFTGGNLELHYDVPDDWVKSYRLLRPQSENQVMYAWHSPTKVAHSFEIQNISGRVEILNTNDTGEAIAGHGYSLISGDVKREGVTDAEGRLVFDQLPLGEYTLSNTSVQPEYEILQEVKTISITEEQLQHQVSFIHQGFSEGVISVNKKDQAGASLAGVHFGLFRGGDEIAKGVTDSQGKLEFKHVSSGDYEVVEKQVDPHYILNDDPHKVSLTRAEPLVEVMITNQRKDIRIRVQLQDEASLPKAGVKVLLKKGEEIVSSALTEASGQVIFKDLNLGDYTVEFEEIPAGFEKPEARNVTLSSTDPRESSVSEDIVVTLNRKSYRINVLKVDEQDKPLSGVRFELLSADREVLEGGETSEKGELQFKDLPFGSYYVREVSTLNNYILEDEPHLVVLVEDQQSTQLRLTNKPRTYQIRVSVVGPVGEPVVGTMLSLYGDDGLITQGRTAAEGQVNFSPKEAGSYSLEITELPQGYHVDEKRVEVHLDVLDPTLEHISKEIVIPAGFSGGAISLKKSASDGGVLSGVKFALRQGDETVEEKITDASGIVSFSSLGYGSYELIEMEVDPHYTLDQTPQKVELTKTNPKSTLSMTNQRKEIGVDVLIKDDGGQALGDVVIGIFDKEGNLLQEKTSNDEGRVSFRDLDLGEYILKPIQGSPVHGDLPEQEVHLISESPDEKAVIKEVSLIAKRLQYTVIITKLDAKSHPLEGILFGLYDAEGELIEEKRTDSDGQAHFEGLYAGSYSYRELETKDYLVLDDKSYSIEISDSNTRIERQLINHSKGVSLIISEEDGETGEPISGSVMDVLDQDGNVVDSGRVVDGKLTIGDLEEGDYRLIQREPAPGYTAGEDIVFSVDPTQKLVQDVSIKSTKNTVLLSRVDADTLKALAGSTLELVGQNGLVDTYITKGVVKLRGLQAGEYTLKETKAPGHYQLAKPVEFIVKVEDDLLRVELSSSATYTLSIHKVDKYTEESLPGAVFEIFSGEKSLGDYETDDDGYIHVDLSHGTYLIREIKSPEGYVNEQLELEVNLHHDQEVVVTNIKEKTKEPGKPEVEDEEVEDDKKEDKKPLLPRTGVSTSLGVLFLGAGLIALALRLLKKKRV